MTGNNRFNHILDRVDMMIEEGLLDESRDLLEQVYSVKPVGIRWFVSNARYMKKSGKTVGDVIEYLKDKCSLDYEYDGVDDYVSYMHELYMSDGNMCEYYRLKYEYDRMLGKEQESEQNFPADLDGMGMELTNHIPLLLVIMMTIFRKNLRKISKEIVKYLEFVDVIR